jgi:hypothetical protein
MRLGSILPLLSCSLSACTIEIPHGLWLQDAARKDAPADRARADTSLDQPGGDQLADLRADRCLVDQRPADRSLVDQKPGDKRPPDTRKPDTRPLDTRPPDTRPPDMPPSSCAASSWSTWACKITAAKCQGECTLQGLPWFVLACKVDGCTCTRGLTANTCSTPPGLLLCPDCEKAFLSGCCAGL